MYNVMGDKMKLRVMADDFGLTKGINYAIYDACKNGIVSAVSLMVNTKYSEHALDLLKGLDVSLGISLNVTHYKGLLDIPSLSEFGFLKPQHDYDLVLGDVKLEFMAQIDYALKVGLKPDYLCTYDDLHMKDQRVMALLEGLAEDYQIPLRRDNYTEMFHDRLATIDTILQLIGQPLDYLEIRTKPGFLDGHLINISKYREMRMVEHSVLTSEYVIHLMKERGINLV